MVVVVGSIRGRCRLRMDMDVGGWWNRRKVLIGIGIGVKSAVVVGVWLRCLVRGLLIGILSSAKIKTVVGTG